LMHELNHQFEANDHYHEAPSGMSSCMRIAKIGGSGFCSNALCNKNNGTINRPDTCIMNNSRQDISSSNIICGTLNSGCKGNIMSHLRSSH